MTGLASYLGDESGASPADFTLIIAVLGAGIMSCAMILGNANKPDQADQAPVERQDVAPAGFSGQHQVPN